MKENLERKIFDLIFDFNVVELIYFYFKNGY